MLTTLKFYETAAELLGKSKTLENKRTWVRVGVKGKLHAGRDCNWFKPRQGSSVQEVKGTLAWVASNNVCEHCYPYGVHDTTQVYAIRAAVKAVAEADGALAELRNGADVTRIPEIKESLDRLIDLDVMRVKNQDEYVGIQRVFARKVKEAREGLKVADRVLKERAAELLPLIALAAMTPTEASSRWAASGCIEDLFTDAEAHLIQGGTWRGRLNQTPVWDLYIRWGELLLEKLETLDRLDKAETFKQYIKETVELNYLGQLACIPEMTTGGTALESSRASWNIELDKAAGIMFNRWNARYEELLSLQKPVLAAVKLSQGIDSVDYVSQVITAYTVLECKQNNSVVLRVPEVVAFWLTEKVAGYARGSGLKDIQSLEVDDTDKAAETAIALWDPELPKEYPFGNFKTCIESARGLLKE